MTDHLLELARWSRRGPDRHVSMYVHARRYVIRLHYGRYGSDIAGESTESPELAAEMALRLDRAAEERGRAESEALDTAYLARVGGGS